MSNSPSVPVSHSMFAREFARLRRHRLFQIGAVIVGLLVLLAIFGPLFIQADPNKISIRTRFEAPGTEFVMGTDNYGRSVFARVVYGARLSLLFGASVAAISTVFGTLLGAIAGYVRRLDNVIMRAMDALMAFPAIFLAIGIAAALGPSLLNGIIALAVVYTPHTARIVRASVLVTRDVDYVEAARASGVSSSRILIRHIMPNSMAPLIVQITFVFAYAVLAEAILSFLGLGPQPPTPTWGNIIAEGREYLRNAPWICVFPGAVLALAVLGLNLLGDGLRDALDPRLTSSRV